MSSNAVSELTFLAHLRAGPRLSTPPSILPVTVSESARPNTGGLILQFDLSPLGELPEHYCNASQCRYRSPEQSSLQRTCTGAALSQRTYFFPAWTWARTHSLRPT